MSVNATTMNARLKQTTEISQGPLSVEEQWKYLYQARTFEVHKLQKAHLKKNRKIEAMKRKIARLEKHNGNKQ